MTKMELLGIEEIISARNYEYSAKTKDYTNILIKIPKQAVLDALD